MMKATYHFILLLTPAYLFVSAHAEEFDMSLMEKMANMEGIDASVLDNGSEVVAGEYPVDLHINDDDFGQVTLPFESVNGRVQPVFTLEQLTEWGITPDRKLQGSHPLKAYISQASVNANPGSEKLSLSVPQASYLPPTTDIAPQRQWNDGLSAARINYNLNFQQSSGDNRSQSLSSTFNNGLNLGSWRFRNDGYYRYSSNNRTGRYQSSSSYLTHDVAALKGTFRGGDLFTDGKIFSTVSLRGISLFSSQEMRPDNQRFYIPAISGSARSNATVVIRQNGYVIDQRHVPAGPFLIRDLTNAATSADLDITVEESDGSTQHFTQPFNTIAALLPAGVFNYSFAVGHLRNAESNAFSPAVYQASGFYGLNNTFTLLAGQQMASKETFRYQNSGLGLAANLPFVGGVSWLFKQSDTRTGQGVSPRRGKEMETVVSKTFPRTHSILSASWNRRYDRNYQDISDAVSARKGSGSSQSIKERYNLQIDQTFGSVTALLRYGENRAWTGNSDKDVRAGVNFSVSGAQFQLYYTHQHQGNKPADDAFSLNFSVPLDVAHRHSFGYSADYHSHESLRQSVAASGTLLDDSQLSYAASQTWGNDSHNSNLSAAYNGSGGVASAGYARGKGYQQGMLGLQGGVLMHHHGITFGPPLGETVVLVHAPNTQGLKIQNNQNLYTDRWGNAVVPYAVPYRVNDVALDPSTLTRHIDAVSTVRKVVPTQGAIVEAEFAVRRSDRRFVKIVDKQQHPLPFGFVVKDSRRAEVGIGGAAGVLLADFSQAHWPLIVSLNGKNLCRIPQPVTSVPDDSSSLWKLSCL
ncbi:fimbria/pilus outer membrane usher protein [Enterobacteriaceae bacterium C34A]